MGKCKLRENQTKLGTVYLVGAGPGDPGLLTLRGKELLQRAEVVYYDHLIHPALLKFCPQARLHYVGKVGFGNQVGQQEISQNLVEAAQHHAVTVRLKGGDPFIFGRGGEEAQALAAAKIPFEVVPGVSSISAVPAYAGIPLTHREFGSSLAVITGHGGYESSDESGDGGKKSEGESRSLPQDLDWAALAKMSTLVILMGVKNLPEIVSQLLAAGKDPETPIAAIAWGTYPKQKTIKCCLRELTKLYEKSGLDNPSVVVVGEVVRLRESLSWFENRPLFGKRILVTRTRQQASELSERLWELGAEPVEFSTLILQDPETWKPVDQAIQKIEEYDWILFTSVNGVERFFARLQGLGQDIRALHGAQLGAVGPATARALEAKGLQVARQPAEFTTDALAESFSSAEIQGKKILIPRAQEARQEILHLLKKRGAQVEVVPVYQIEKPHYTSGQWKDFHLEALDALSFASSSTVQNFYDLLKETSALQSLLQTPAICIGPITAARAQALGFTKIHEAQEYTIAGMIDALLKYFAKAP